MLRGEVNWGLIGRCQRGGVIEGDGGGDRGVRGGVDRGG